MQENKRRIGKYWEKMVAEYLDHKGYVILFMNYRTRYSEIDIVAQDREELVFIEVKYRKTASAGNPLEAVDLRKQKRIRNAALYFLSDNDYDIENTAIRFDVIGILDKEITHIENAF